MKRIVAALAIAAVVGSASVAQAQSSGTGWYTGLKGGIVAPNNAELTGTGSSTLRITNDYDLGYGLMGVAGYDWGKYRTELEVGYRRSSVDQLNIRNDGGIPAAAGAAAQSGTTRGASGSTDVLSFMGNLLYDVNTGSALEPYLGFGLGFAELSLNNLAVGGVQYTNSSDWRFAYQAVAGVAYWLSDNMALTADYRYFGTLDPRLNDSRGGSFEAEYDAHNLMVGFVYRFGAPPPPPPAPAPAAAPAPAPVPAPAPAPRPAPPAGPKQFIVFFDFDKSDITAQAQRIINDAAAEWKKTGTARITTTGHADRAGADRYNQRLSERRAAGVKDALTKQGVPANNIVTIGRGESQPLVPTADGVREPQNRRVEILF